MRERDVVEAVRSVAEEGVSAEVIGGGSLVERLHTPEDAREIRIDSLRGIVRHDPADLTVTVRAGTRMADLERELAETGQECPVEGLGTTVGGRFASGLSGIRRLGVGHLRDWVLGARVVTAEGSLVRIGGATMKNVTGYDLPRLYCGSWGTLGILTELVLRVRPIPKEREWWETQDLGRDLGTLSRSAAVIRRPDRVHVLLEGDPRDCASVAREWGLERGRDGPAIPSSIRISVPPDRLSRLIARVRGDYAAELGVGNLHLDPDGVHGLRALRAWAEKSGGRMLVLDRAAREGAGIPAFGPDPVELHTCRIRKALDPSGVLAPWRFSS